jgi:hypothetical protein
MGTPSPETTDRFRRLDQLRRMASAESDHAHELLLEAQREVGAARIAFDGATRGLKFGGVRLDAEGKAVFAAEREVRTPTEGGGYVIRYQEHTEPAPQFDFAAKRLHEAQRELTAAREAMQAAGHRAGLFRRVVEQAAEALGRTALPSRPAVVAADPAVPAAPRW